MAWRFDEEAFEARKRENRERWEREAIAEMDAAPASEGLCYFLGCDEGLVKIGFSRKLWQRINRLKGNTGVYKMRLLATARGGRTRERHYHRMFAAHSLGNEFFERCPEIDAEIARLCGQQITPPEWCRTRPDQATVGGSHG